MPETLYTQPELTNLLSEWQKILRLQDWRINIMYVREKEMPSKGQATIDWNLEDKEAAIGIRDPADWVKGVNIELTNRIIESDIVHELIHLMIAPLKHETKFEGLEMVTVENLCQFVAEALLSLKYKSQEEK